LHTAAHDATLYYDILQTDNGSQYLMIDYYTFIKFNYKIL